MHQEKASKIQVFPILLAPSPQIFYNSNATSKLIGIPLGKEVVQQHIQQIQVTFCIEQKAK
jgi:hypothetical protein